MNLNGKNICSVCYKEIPEGQDICIECQNNKVETVEGALGIETVLKGRYILGKCMYYDNSYYCYKAYDALKNTVVLVRELFPIGIAKTRTNLKNLEIKESCQAGEKKIRDIFNNFQTSADTAKQFNNRGFSLPLCDMFAENNTLYCVSAYCEGGEFLSEVLKTKRLSEAEIKNIVKNILTALEIIHAAGFVHGNIRPENIILNGKNVYLIGYHYGSFECVDFSKASVGIQENSYAALEQMTSNKVIGAYTDIYSLGVLWYTMLTGDEFPSALCRASNEEHNVKYDQLSKDENKIIQKMTQISSGERYANIHELAKDINKTGIMSLKSKPQKNKTVGAKNKKRFIAIILIVLAVVIAIGSGVYYFAFFDKGSETGEKEAITATEKPSKPKDDEEKPDKEEKNEEKAPEEKDVDNNPVKPSDTQTNVVWINNVMQPSSRVVGDSRVLGNKKYKRSKITSVEFCDTLDNMGKNAWDVSEAKNKSVMAWVIGSKLYIGAKGGINAKDSTIAMFYNYKKLTEVNFGNSYHTDNSTDMSSMFENCVSLKKIEFPQTFNTENVSSMSQMFDSCRSLAEINLSMFNTSSVMDMSKMFWGCKSIETLNLSNFTANIVISVSEMFKNCSSLQMLDLSNFHTINSVKTDNMFEKCENIIDIVTSDERIISEFKGENNFAKFYN